MASQDVSETYRPPAVDRSHSGARGGSIGMVLLVAVALVGAAVGLLLIGRGNAGPYILALLALLAMAGVVLLLRPLVVLLDVAVRLNAVIPGVTTLIRWQNHWHVVRQSWSFFQNDFAGRIANRVMQTGLSLRESAMASIRSVWYIAALGATACTLMLAADWRLGVPTLVWAAAYVLFLRHFVPKPDEPR